MPKQNYPHKEIVESILARLARMRQSGNYDGVRHFMAFATEAVVPQGNAAQRRRARRITIRATRRLAVAA